MLDETLRFIHSAWAIARETQRAFDFALAEGVLALEVSMNRGTFSLAHRPLLKLNPRSRAAQRPVQMRSERH